MYKHENDHDNWQDENVRGIETKNEIGESAAENSMNYGRSQNRRRIIQRYSDADCQDRPSIEDDIITRECFKNCDRPKNYTCHPNNLISDLEPPAEVIVVHMRESKENHCVGGFIVYVSYNLPIWNLVVDQLHT